MEWESAPCEMRTEYAALRRIARDFVVGCGRRVDGKEAREKGDCVRDDVGAQCGGGREGGEAGAAAVGGVDAQMQSASEEGSPGGAVQGCRAPAIGCASHPQPASFSFRASAFHPSPAASSWMIVVLVDDIRFSSISPVPLVS